MNEVLKLSAEEIESKFTGTARARLQRNLARQSATINVIKQSWEESIKWKVSEAIENCMKNTIFIIIYFVFL